MGVVFLLVVIVSGEGENKRVAYELDLKQSRKPKNLRLVSLSVAPLITTIASGTSGAPGPLSKFVVETPTAERSAESFPSDTLKMSECVVGELFGKFQKATE